MKVISLWQPWASLIVHNFKFIETRGWKVPHLLVGQRIGIAATKNIRAEQRAGYEDETFQQFYSETGLEELDDLPHGMLLGTALLHSCEVMTDALIADLTEEERAFGWYEPGRYAWRLRQPEAYETPVIIKGRQGIFDHDPHGIVQKALDRAPQERPERRGNLHVPFGRTLLSRVQKAR